MQKGARTGRPNVVGTRVVGCPDKTVVHLRYPILKQLSSPASSQGAVRFITNGVYDVDPTLGSTSTPYFAEWMAMYSYYRVLNYKLEINVTSLEFVPVNVYIVHSNTDPGTTGINYLQYANASYNKITSLASASAQHSKRITTSLSPLKLVGDRAVRTEQNFWGSSSSNPVDLTYIGIGASISVGSLNSGISIDGFIEFKVEFFDRKNLQVSFLKQPYPADEVIKAINRIQFNDARDKKNEKSDLDIRDAMVAWRKQMSEDPYEKQLLKKLRPYVMVE